MSQAEQGNQGNQAQKVEKAFDGVMGKLTAIVSGKIGSQAKLEAGSLGGVVEALFKEEREENEKAVKEGLKALLKGHVLLNKTIAEEEVKFEKLKIEKKKEFNKAANALFSKIDGLGALEAEYTKSLASSLGSDTEEH